MLSKTVNLGVDRSRPVALDSLVLKILAAGWMVHLVRDAVSVYVFHANGSVSKQSLVSIAARMSSPVPNVVRSTLIGHQCFKVIINEMGCYTPVPSALAIQITTITSPVRLKVSVPRIFRKNNA